ncbi:MAG: DUF11 domain-containing protein, partial [Chloroflexi bacterium]
MGGPGQPIALAGSSVSVRGSFGNTIGGTTPGARNIISGSVSLGGHPVPGQIANNVLQGNYIGTDVTGEVALGGGGVQLSGIGNIVGGTVPGAGNLISGNSGVGLLISFDGSSPLGGGRHVVQGNRIGTDKDGTSPVANRGDGISIFNSGTTIGGLEPGAGNLISGNGGNGILLTRGGPSSSPAVTGNLIQGNFIGTQANGVGPLGNLGDGINVADTGGIGAVNNSIGGLASGAGNVIAYNGGNGLNVLGGTRIAILSNSIFSNAKLGIDLNGDGPTPNDTGDGDGGNNNLQNFPVLTSISNTGGNVTTQGTLNSRPNSTYRLEFLTHIITATATDAQGNTSEFSGRQPNASPGETANLSVAISDAPDPALAGELLTYDITVANTGPDDATNVTVLDTWPAGATFASATLSQGVYGLVGTAVVGSLGTITRGSTATVHITVVPTTTGVITNSVRVASDQFDPDTTNNTVSASTTIIPGADLSVTKSAGAVGRIGVGSEIPFTLTVSNHGPSPASAVRLTDTLPASMTFDHFFGGITGTYSAGVVTWDFGSLASGASRTVLFSAIINEVGISTDIAQVASTTGDPNPANNIATLDVRALPTADLALTKTAAPSPAHVGERLTYTLTVSNSGPSDAEGVVLTDTLPETVTFDSASSSQGSFVLAAGMVTFDLGVLSSGSAVSVEIVVKPTVAGTFLFNSAVVSASRTLDVNPGDNETALETIVSAPYPAALYGAAQRFGGASILYAIDPATGAAAPVGPIGFDRISGMDFEPRTGILYATGNRPGTNTHVLITIDPSTGVGTEVGPTDINSINFNNTATDISFRSSDGALFAYLRRNSDLAIINLATGRATFIGSTFAAGSAGNGLAFSPGDTLYHADEIELDTLDPETGLATLLVPLSFSAPADTFPRINAMDFDPTTSVLFGSLSDGFGGDENYLATVDIVSGVVSIIGSTAAGLDAIAFFPTPTSSNQPPALARIGDLTSDEGVLFSQTGSFVDPDGGDSWAATVDYGDGSGLQALALSGTAFQLSHVFADDGVYPVMVKVIDSQGGVGTDTGHVTVRNVAPVLANLSATTIDENGVTALTGKIIDPGTLDTFTLEVN